MRTTITRLTGGAGLPLLLFGLLAVCFLYILPRWADWNQNSRFNLVLAIVDDGSVAIDRYVENTGDYAHYRGRYYSDKAPGLSLAAVPIYATVRALIPATVIERLGAAAQRSQALEATTRPDGSGLRADKVSYFLGLTIATAITVALPSAVLGVLLFWLSGFLLTSLPARLATALLYALATSALPYSNTFVGHQPAAVLLVIAFALMLAIRRRGWPVWWLVTAGFALGWAAITEYPTVLIGGALGLYGLIACSGGRLVRALLLLAAGALPPLVLLAGYDYLAFGTILPVGYFHSALWTDVHQTGLVSLTYPQLPALWGITFGIHRGLFFLSPYLLLAVPGYLFLWRRRDLRAEWAVLLAAPVLFLLFNGSSAMWQGGFAIGPRYFLPALPFLALVAGVGLAWAWARPVGRFIALVLAVWSVIVVWAQTLGGQSFPDYSANPLLDFSLPRLLSGDIARNLGMALGLAGWASLAPLLIIILAAGAVLIPLLARSRPDAGVAREGRLQWLAK